MSIQKIKITKCRASGRASKDIARHDLDRSTLRDTISTNRMEQDLQKEIQSLDPTIPKEVIRVSISEAARLFGVNPQTIRRALKDQEITYVVVAGRYKLNFESLVKWSQRKTTVRNKSNQKGIGQYVDKWKINNTLYSPSSKFLKPEEPIQS